MSGEGTAGDQVSRGRVSAGRALRERCGVGSARTGVRRGPAERGLEPGRGSPALPFVGRSSVCPVGKRGAERGPARAVTRRELRLSALAFPAQAELDNGRPCRGLARSWSLNAAHSGRKLQPGQAVYRGSLRCYIK